MKKILKFLAAAALAFSVAGCKSESYEDLYQKGSSSLDAKNYEDAVSTFSKAIELDPSQEGAYEQLAYAYSRLGDTDNEIAAWNSLIEQNPSYDKAYSSLSTVYAQQGDYDLAAETTRKLIDVLKQSGDQDALLKDAYKDLIEEQKYLPDGMAARDTIREFYETWPDDEEAILLQAEALAKEGGTEAAERLLSDACEKNPSDALKNALDALNPSSGLAGMTFNIIGRIQQFNDAFINYDTSCTIDSGCGYGDPIGEIPFSFSYQTDPESGYAYLDRMTGGVDENGMIAYDCSEGGMAFGDASSLMFENGYYTITVMENANSPDGVYTVMATDADSGVNVFLDADYKVVSVNASYLSSEGEYTESEDPEEIKQIYDAISPGINDLLDILKDFNEPISLDLSQYLDVSVLQEMFSQTWQ